MNRKSLGLTGLFAGLVLFLCSCGVSADKIAGVYECEFGMGYSMGIDLRRDMSAYMTYQGSSEGAKQLHWEYEGGEVVLGKMRFKLEGVDLIDKEGRRWMRLR